MKKILAALFLLAAANHAQAATASLDLALSNESANLAVDFTPPGAVAASTVANLGGIYNENHDLIFFGTLMARGSREFDRNYVTLGAGLKAYGGSVDELDQSVGALAIGGELGVVLVPSANPIDMLLQGFVAPSITTFGDTEKLVEFSAKLRVEIVRSARAYVGYRLMQVDTEDYDDIEIDDNIHVGINIDFY
ncbi:YfaZ family outer membrane protein [Granulosicoccaceae sp. 1_MG-2023]|nr:YfaZ family outer membrane protein [Granulosicoccaceae sp. 1_MG-2023]